MPHPPEPAANRADTAADHPADKRAVAWRGALREAGMPAGASV